MGEDLSIVIDANISSFPESATTIPGQDNWLENCLLSLGFKAAHLPLGSLLSAYHNLEPGVWVVAAPIYWQASHNDALILAAGKELNLEEENFKHLFELTAKFFKEDNIQLYYHDKYTWFFRADNKPYLSSRSISNMLHQSCMPILEKLDKTLYWQRLFTEIQMLYSSVNSQKVNGLWFYGNEELILPSIPIYSDDANLIKAFPGKITPLVKTQLNLTKPLKFFLKDKKKIDIFFKDNLRRYDVQWFWNNAAYRISQENWWQKLRRKIC